MQKLKVELPYTSYDIFIGNDLLKDVGIYTKNSAGGNKAMVVTDETVNYLYGDIVLKSLSAAGYDVGLTVFPAGEQTKCMESLVSLYDRFADHGITRKDVVVALGGGVIGDLSGLAAATWLRGVKFVQVPTTLLAQIDSSVGGKVAIDMPHGKNLVGTFYQPCCVICDLDALKSLDDETFFCGLAEAIKCGIIADSELFSIIENAGDREQLYKIVNDIVLKSLNVKINVVQQDERDTGNRMLLNFGHTLGHAVEAAANFEIPHGRAVAIGMAAIARAVDANGISEDPIYKRLLRVLTRFELPTNAKYSVDELMPFILSDKKADSNSVTIVMPLKIGKAVLQTVSVGMLPTYAKEVSL